MLDVERWTFSDKSQVLMRALHSFAVCIFGLSAQITAMFAAESDNPLINESVLPYHYPDFDKLRDENFVPAIEAGMREQLNEIDPIANSSEKPTFENTIVAMERTGDIADGFRTECVEGAECIVGSRR